MFPNAKLTIKLKFIFVKPFINLRCYTGKYMAVLSSCSISKPIPYDKALLSGNWKICQLNGYLSHLRPALCPMLWIQWRIGEPIFVYSCNQRKDWRWSNTMDDIHVKAKENITPYTFSSEDKKAWSTATSARMKTPIVAHSRLSRIKVFHSRN